MPNEIARRRCEQCEYMALDIPISEKKTECPWDTRLACDVYLTTERLKDRVNYLAGKQSALFISGAAGCIDTFMQQLPAAADNADLKKRLEKITQAGLY